MRRRENQESEETGEYSSTCGTAFWNIYSAVTSVKTTLLPLGSSARCGPRYPTSAPSKGRLALRGAQPAAQPSHGHECLQCCAPAAGYVSRLLYPTLHQSLISKLLNLIAALAYFWAMRKCPTSKIKLSPPTPTDTHTYIHGQVQRLRQAPAHAHAPRPPTVL